MMIYDFKNFVVMSFIFVIYNFDWGVGFDFVMFNLVDIDNF